MGILKALFGQKQDEMGIFTETTSAFDEQVEKVTAEHMMTENWALILDLCDKISVDPKAPKQALLSIRKRLNHRDPHVVILALSVLDSCWGNCGSNFRKEVSSAAFKNELQSKATHSTRLIAEKTRLMIRKWVETECKTDASLSLIVTLYKELLADGYSFESQQPEKKKIPISNDPNVVHSQEEEDAIAKAIALSLKDAEKQPKTSQLYPSNGATSNGKATTSNNNSMYPNLLPVSAPSFAAPNISKSKNTTYPTSILKKKVTFDPPSALSPTPSSITIPLTADTVGPSEQQLMEKINQYVGLKNQSVERTVRALYDFEAAEDNELSFVTGDLITVTDDTNPNWWKGRIGGHFGLFPSSFVTSDLSEVKPELSAAKLEPARPRAVIDESILLECIQLLEECDPAGIRPDPPRLAQVESASIAQGPLIDAHLASIDRQSNALAQVDMAIRDVLALYDQAVQQTQYQPSVMYQQPPQMPMHGMQQQPTAQMPHQYAGYPNAPTGVMPPQQPQQPPMSMPYQPQQQYSTAGYAPPPQHVQPPQQMAPQHQQQQQPYQHYAPPPQPQQHQMSYHQPEWNQQQQPMQQPQPY